MNPWEINQGPILSSVLLIDKWAPAGREELTVAIVYFTGLETAWQQFYPQRPCLSSWLLGRDVRKVTRLQFSLGSKPCLPCPCAKRFPIPVDTAPQKWWVDKQLGVWAQELQSFLQLGWLRFPRSLSALLPEGKSVPRSPVSASGSPSIRPCRLSCQRDTLRTL